MKLLKEALEGIKQCGDYEKQILKISREIIQKINKNTKDAKAVLGGSGAKGTWIGTFDADIFVKFNYAKYKDRSNGLSAVLEKAIKKCLPGYTKIHGSRDYFQIKQGNFTFEIIPILDIKKADEAKNITDISPLHTKWVLRHKGLGDEIRLTKKFCKALGIYGAESHIKGLSGYVCEILTVNYGSFLRLAKNAAKWKSMQAIDYEGYYKGKDIRLTLNKSKLISPLVVIDPVQKERNAAAALSRENYEIFTSACRRFIKKPSLDFFTEKNKTLEHIRKAYPGKTVIALEAEPLEGKEDITGCKIIKVKDYVQNALKDNGFNVLGSGIESNKTSLVFFAIDKKTIPESFEREGPPAILKKHVKDFKKKYKKTFLRGDRVYATDKRRFRDAEILVMRLIRQAYVKEKVKGIRIK